MASQQELEASAGKHARAASWSWDKFLSTIRSDPDYAYKNTEWYRAGGDLQKTKGGGGTPTPPPQPGSLAAAQCRIFLAQAPLDSLAAPPWMVPVCTADHGYREWYSADIVSRLRQHFGTVEAWCDCRASGGTSYSEAVRMVEELHLDGPAWGQCETAAEFDHGYEAGARRMVGQLAGLRPDQSARIGAGEVLLAFELYRNVMPWQVPDYGTSGAGVGGNCIGVYASETEGATYTPVETYKGLGYYVPHRDSVYGVGLHPDDWKALG